MVGSLADPARAGRLAFAREGDAVAIVGGGAQELSLAASELAKAWGEALPNGLAAIDIDAAIASIEAVRDAVAGGELTLIKAY